MFEALSLLVGFGPRKPNDVREKHFGELMAECHAFGKLAAFTRKIDAAGAIDFHKIVTRKALQRSRNGGRSDAEFFGKARADGGLPFFEHFPDRFEIVFARDAGLLPLHIHSEDSGCVPGTAPFPARSRAARSSILFRMSSKVL